MRKKPKLDLGINAYEELFMDENERNAARLPKIYDIPIELIDDFPSHPFKVNMDEDMENLVASIKEQGLITPVILRPKDGGRYEMVSGHRRKEACLLAGFTTIKAEVREITQDEAIILMVDSNLQRTMILPSEKAFSYKMRLEAIKRQGKRTDLTCRPVGDKLTKQRSGEILGDSVGESERQIQRYIRLTELIPELLDLVDGRKMALRPAVELSYLTPDEQKVVFDETMIRDCMPSHAQTIRMRKMSERNMLTDSIIDDIMREEKPNQKEKIHIPYSEIRMFMPKGMSFEKTVDYIKKALEYYQKTYSE